MANRSRGRTEPDLTGKINLQPRRRHAAWSALLLGLTIVALLWMVNIRYRRVYVPRLDDVTALADGLLLLPQARWVDWFTRGHTHFFDAYPEWPWGLSGFARPAFQFTIYVAHFIFGRDWASYLGINYLAVAGPAVVAFAIARTTLGLGVGASLASASLVLFSPAVLEFSIWELGFGSEPMASLFVGCAFLAIATRRYVLCVLILSVAVLTKETAVWAPFAAAITVLIQGGRRRSLWATAMLLPIAGWLALRFAFFGGIGGTYASPHYTPIAGFLDVTVWKLTHLHQLLVARDYAITEGEWLFVDRAARVGTALVITLLVIHWAWRSFRAGIAWLGAALRQGRPAAADNAVLVALWGAMGLAFYFALTLPDLRYGTSAVMFLWPAMIDGIVRRRSAWLRLGLAACVVLSIERASHLFIEMNPPPEASNTTQLFRAVTAMNSALRQVPPGIQQVFVLSAGDDLSDVGPDYLQAFLGVPFEIVRVIDVDWDCNGAGDRVVFDRSLRDGVVSLSAALPDCAQFLFEAAILDSRSLVGGRLTRSTSISYELPQARPLERREIRSQIFDLGRRMTAHIRPRGPARFIIEHAGGDGGLVWFDYP